MPTVRDLGLMAAAVYESPGAAGYDVKGWARARSHTATGFFNGFQAATFIGGGETVLAFRGTAQTMDGVADLTLGVGMNSTYFAAGDDYAFQYRHLPNVYVCGHSLGGAIAQVVANRGRFKFVTFNAPGVAVVASRNWDELAIGAVIGTLKIRAAGMVVSALLHPVQAAQDVAAAFRTAHGLNVCLNFDAVSQIGVHYGKVLRISGTSTNPATEHRMATVNSVLRKGGSGQVVGDMEGSGI